MASQRNTGAFIIGGVLGGMVGAAFTLWNTPKSGEELRAMLSGGQATASGEAGSQSPAARNFSNPVLSFVEKAAAPLVGVELGKLAKDDPDAVRHTPVRSSAADARPPTPAGITQAQSAEEEATHREDGGSTAHVATTDELTSPPGSDTSSQASNR